MCNLLLDYIQLYLYTLVWYINDLSSLTNKVTYYFRSVCLDIFVLFCSFWRTIWVTPDLNNNIDIKRHIDRHTLICIYSCLLPLINKLTYSINQQSIIYMCRLSLFCPPSVPAGRLTSAPNVGKVGFRSEIRSGTFGMENWR